MKKPAGPARKSGKKMRKSDFEEKFALMVGEYNKQKELLDAMSEGDAEHAKQKKKCDALFASAERFLNANQ
ncbi:hypothetical protein H4F17_13930 [Vibrio cholerae]